MDVEMSNKAYEYLYATIQTADWISDEYKRVAEMYKNHAALKELYMCICDGVNIDVLEVLAIDDDIEEVLKKCRKKHLESDFLKRYSDVVDRINVITTKTEYEVKNMSNTVKYIADVLPAKAKPVELPEPIVVKEELSETKVQVEPKAEEQSIKESAPLTVEKSPAPEEKSKQNWREVLRDPIGLLMNKYRRNPRRTVVEMLAHGYSDEQINFIYSCIEDGMTDKEINKFADPKIKVETMERLKKVVLKEREKNG